MILRKLDGYTRLAAFKNSCKEYVTANPDKLDPIDFDQYLNCAIKDTAMEHIRIFRKDMIS